MTKILVIEDNEPIRSNIVETLQYEGFTALEAPNGLVGVQMALTAPPDLIICDIMMPEKDGFAVLRELREQPSTQNIPFIFLTANADRASVRQGMNLGADDYLTKPFTSNELITAITARLEKWAATDRLYQQSLEELRANLILMLPHELRTPLIGILGYGELMRLEYESMDAVDIRQIGEVITSEGQRLQHVIENYFLYAQIELAERNPEARATFMKGRVEAPGTLIREVAMAKAGKLKRDRDLQVDTENVVMDMALQSLWKIVEELVDNAFKFSVVGTPIEVKSYQEGDTYILQIKDCGRGMTPEQIRHIGAYIQFERKQYEQQGLGLGLILAKRLVEICKGTFAIESQPQQGTTVTVILPLASQG